MSQKRILIIEDNPVNMELAADLLEASGFVTLQADNAEDGIRVATAEKPDLVLMDVALPGMDGLTATAILRQQPLTAHIPIVALTAHAMKGDEDKALAVGCIGYITKPINTRSFTRMVAEFCEKKPDASVGAGQTVVPPMTLPPVKQPQPTVHAPLPTTTLPPNWADTPSTPASPARPAERRPSVPILTDDATLIPPAHRPAQSPQPASGFPSARADVQPPLGTPLRPTAPPPAVTPTDELLPIPGDNRPVYGKGFIEDGVVEPPLMPLPNTRQEGRGESGQPFMTIPRKGRGGRQRESIAIVSESSVAKILVVDDDELNREMITAQLRLLGYEPAVAVDGFQALEMVDETYDLVLLDYMMPGMDGCEVCRQIRDDKRMGDLPIIMVTALSNRDDQLRAVQMGANDWITKPVDRTELEVRVKSHLKFKAAQDALKRHQRDLEATVRARTAELRKALEGNTKEAERTHEAYLDTMHRLALASEFRDGFMAAAHIRCVGNYCAAIARGMGLPDNVAEVLLHASPLHDIGMLGVPEAIIYKGDSRTPDEEAQYRDHTMLGARLLSGARSELLRAAEVIALSHHEKWDGSGYPHGRSGESIPLYGRICAVADTFDTITSYKAGEWQATNDEAKEVLLAGRGSEFDPAVVDAFLKVWSEIEMFQKRYRRTEAPPEDMFQRKLVAA